MKITLLILLTYSLQAFGSFTEYSIQEAVCGEIDPYVIGDACLMRVSGKSDEFIVIMDLDEVAKINDGRKLTGACLTMDTELMIPASAVEREEIASFNDRNLKIFRAPVGTVRFL